MDRALKTAASGMYAQQLNVDAIANNLANVNTTAFKQTRVEFQDLMYETLRGTGIPDQQGGTPPAELQVGDGTVPSSTTRNFGQGDLQPTQNQLDFAIQGDGFFRIRKPDGTEAYTRDGSFKVSGDGNLVTSNGYLVDPGFTIPQDTTGLQVKTDGTIEATVSGQTTPVTLGQFELAKFVNPAGLHAVGSNLYEETVASGTPILGNPSSTGFGDVLQGYLESSNVSIVKEMVKMIEAERAYELNSKAIQTADNMMQLANNIKR
ncbi:MAG: flagellar basal-body rod protein FlgG [Bacteroidetes bacterium]|nr:flagellar basal-body rod protein FlgG [Bacteroidota bacterium]MCL5738265.1 flagellar basal-body rod protein FlgG [Bacteroidota bacterium]